MLFPLTEKTYQKDSASNLILLELSFYLNKKSTTSAYYVFHSYLNAGEVLGAFIITLRFITKKALPEVNYRRLATRIGNEKRTIEVWRLKNSEDDVYNISAHAE